MKNYKIPLIGFLILTFTIVNMFGMFGHLMASGDREVINAFPVGYTEPDDLFYTFLKSDQAYISQTIKEHFSRNGYLATDIATNGNSLTVYAPSYMYLEDGKEIDSEQEYIVGRSINTDTMGLAVELSFGDKKFVVGHMKEIFVKDGQKVTTGTPIGLSGGCPGELKYNEKSTGCHIHLEFYVDGSPTMYPEYLYNNHGGNLEAYREWQENKKDRKSRIVKGESLAALDEKYFNYDFPYILSAIHEIENGRCVKDCHRSNMGAVGPFQFMEATWAEYMCDGNGDWIADPKNIDDAMCTAENYLTSLYNNEQSYNQDLDPQWIWWRAFYRYNAGYSCDANHKEGLAGGISYADNVLSISTSLSAK